MLKEHIDRVVGQDSQLKFYHSNYLGFGVFLAQASEKIDEYQLAGKHVGVSYFVDQQHFAMYKALFLLNV